MNWMRCSRVGRKVTTSRKVYVRRLCRRGRSIRNPVRRIGAFLLERLWQRLPAGLSVKSAARKDGPETGRFPLLKWRATRVRHNPDPESGCDAPLLKIWAGMGGVGSFFKKLQIRCL